MNRVNIQNDNHAVDLVSAIESPNPGFIFRAPGRGLPTI